jgi:hypothetical protein
MQIYRLLKAGAFRLGTARCRRWAEKARARTGADIPASERDKTYQRLINVLQSRGRKARARVGWPHLNSRLLREKQRPLFREYEQFRREYPEMVESQKSELQRLHQVMAKRPLSTVQLVAEIQGDPLTAENDSFNPGNKERTVAVERLAEKGAAGTGGKRWSRKRVSFDKIQLIINELSATNGRVSFSALADKLHINVATLYRWRTSGHLRLFAKGLKMDGYGNSISEPENRGKMTPTRDSGTLRSGSK